MIRFHNTPKDQEALISSIRELIGEPHAHDGQTFLFNTPMPHRYKRIKGEKSMIDIYRLGGYPIDLEYENDGRTVALKDGTVYSHSSGQWKKHVNV